MRNQYQYQPFHLVTPSPWPIITSFALLILTTSAVIYFNGYANPFGGLTIVYIGIFTTIGAIVFWFRDVSAEGTYLGDHTINVQQGLTVGILLFIISEVFFFLSIFWSYFHSSLSPTIEIGAIWPPIGITTINAFELPILNTFLLLSSGATITFSHHALIKGNRSEALQGGVLTLLFSFIFTLCQIVEYINAPFTISDGVFGSVFYFSTAFHGIHVIVGTLFLSVGIYKLLNYHITDHHHLGFESAILYWHFVDIVWLFLFITVYWWGS